MTNFTREVVRRIGDGAGRNQALEEIEWVGPVRGCRVRNTTTQGCNNEAVAVIQFNTEMFDLGGCWSTAASTHLIAPRDGYYVIEANVMWYNNGDTDGARILFIDDNDGNTIGEIRAAGSADTYIAQQVTSGLVRMEASDYAVVKVYQNSGARMQIQGASTTAAQYACHASIIRMH